jgi:hypothetical protein
VYRVKHTEIEKLPATLQTLCTHAGTTSPRGRPRKKPRMQAPKDQAVHEQSRAPRTSPSHVLCPEAGTPPVNADVDSSDAEAPPVDVDVGRSDISRPSGGASVEVPGTGTPPAHVKDDDDSDWAWDSGAGLKPSQLDGNTSDESVEVEDFLPEAGERVQRAMVDMMVELEDCDPRDLDWLRPKEPKKVMPKKLGMICLRA